MAQHLTIAANNGDIGGGEVMLLAIAKAARTLGVTVNIVGPNAPDGVITAASAQGFEVTGLAPDRRSYLRELRTWDRRHRRGVLWCNGLVPAIATLGRADRIVHLHQRPAGAQRLGALIATQRSLLMLVPSDDMTRILPGAAVMWNWTDDTPTREPTRSGPATPGRPTRLGFLGRPSPDKGILVLADAVENLDLSSPGSYRLVLAGEPRFVDTAERAKVSTALDRIEHLVDRLGWVDRATFFEAVDLAVFPSVGEESFGLVVAEAMAARTPFIISDVGALREVAGPDHPWVAPAGDPAALERTILQASAVNDIALTAYTDRARARWEKNFSPAAGQRRLAEVLTHTGIL